MRGERKKTGSVYLPTKPRIMSRVYREEKGGQLRQYSGCLVPFLSHFQLDETKELHVGSSLPTRHVPLQAKSPLTLPSCKKHKDISHPSRGRGRGSTPDV